MRSAVVAALIGSVAASHNAHAGFHHRRYAEETCAVVTVTETVYAYPTEVEAPHAYNSTVYVEPYPAPTSTPCDDEPSSVYIPIETSTPCPEDSETVYVPTSYPETSDVPAYPPASEEYVPTEVAAPPPAYTPPPVPTYVPSPPPYEGDGGKRIVVNGDFWAMTYTPYTRDGQCKSKAEVEIDIANIAKLGFTTIRSYSTDCGVFENVQPACKKHGLKIIFGIFIEAGGKGGRGPFSDYANNQLEDIKKYADKSLIAMIIIGNEAIFNKYTTAVELAAYIDFCRKSLYSVGFSKEIYITTTETVDVWTSYGKPLCDHIDVFAVQVHPFFTAKISASFAGVFAKAQLELAATVCPKAAARGKFITEIGWPKHGNANGLAIPGVKEQHIAIKSILKVVGKFATLFSYQDDYWKEPGAYGVEQSWGCADAFY